MAARGPILFTLWRQEFGGYSRERFGRDLVAGLTVAAVALPLALAFGVASGATAAAGLVTAIIAGFVIGALSGAPYQISGPTGAMSAVLIVIAQEYGLRGLWLAGLLAGLIVLALGLFRLGRIINFIPAPVITGFTSGIALVIAIGQIDNFLGVQTPGNASSARKLLGYFSGTLPPINIHAVICALGVMATMIILPRFRWGARLPAALLGIVVVTALAALLGWPVTLIGTIPATLILPDRYIPARADLDLLSPLLGPAVAIAALGAIESLLAGVVAGRMTGQKLAVNQELVAQGVGNILLPFFGGVPATAAIARMSVGVKAGGVTRLVSVIHALTLLAGALLLGSTIGRIPLAALAGVLLVTAFRMNEWHVIRFYVARRLSAPLLVLLVTMLATMALDLTQAIVVGVGVSLLLFLNQVSRLEIVSAPVDWARLRAGGLSLNGEVDGIEVVYISGSLYFGATGQLTTELERLHHPRAIILSMRGVPLIDASSLHAIEHFWREQAVHGGALFICGLQPPVRKMFDRAGLTAAIGPERFHWSATEAIVAAHALLSTTQENAAPPSLPSDDFDAAERDMPLGVVMVD
ncbi:MAG TPA: SulP family inorganic anion transporter [Thermomicrobiales bacterium]|jgi:SulP family sulfate permease